MCVPSRLNHNGMDFLFLSGNSILTPKPNGYSQDSLITNYKILGLGEHLNFN